MIDKLKKRLETKIELGLRTDYEKDYTAILYSHAFKRLKHKTQVFVLPHNDHITTRMDHSLYVAAISSIICRNLLDKDVKCDPLLAHTIALGHDLGHSPFGHAGEKVLNRLAKDIGGFKHELHSLRIVDKIEKPRNNSGNIGLNLTVAVRDGIVNHCGESFLNKLRPSEIPKPENIGKEQSVPCTIEGCVVRLVDKISYLGRDIEDAIRVGFLSEKDLPAHISVKIGTKNGEIIDFFVRDIISNSNSDLVAFSDKGSNFLNKLMKYNYSNIYMSDHVKGYVEHIERLIEHLFELLFSFSIKYKDNIKLYKNNNHICVKKLGLFIEKRKEFYFNEENFNNEDNLYIRIIIDYIAGFTDKFVFDSFKELFIPKPVI